MNKISINTSCLHFKITFEMSINQFDFEVQNRNIFKVVLLSLIKGIFLCLANVTLNWFAVLGINQVY